MKETQPFGLQKEVSKKNERLGNAGNMIDFHSAIKAFEDNDFQASEKIYKVLYESALNRFGPMHFRQYAYCLIESGKYREAINILDNWEAAQGLDAIQLSMRSHACDHLDQLDSAIDAMRKSLEQKARASGYCILADLFKKKSDYQNAKLAYSKALLLDPSYGEAIFGIENLAK